MIEQPIGAFYGLYRFCRDASWRCQLEFDVCRLPVKVTNIAKQAGIKVIRDSAVKELKPSELAVSMFDGESWTIIYNDSLDTKTVRFAAAHELGHIFLGHEYRLGEKRFVFTGRKLSFEREADMFAVRLLAPAFVLHELKLLTPEGISAVCGMPISYARDRAKRMEVLEKRGMFYTSSIERAVYDKFKAYIDEFRAEKAAMGQNIQ